MALSKALGQLQRGGCTEGRTDTETCWEEAIQEKEGQTQRPARRRLYRRKDRHGNLPGGGCTEGRTDTETSWEAVATTESGTEGALGQDSNHKARELSRLGMYSEDRATKIG